MADFEGDVVTRKQWLRAAVLAAAVVPAATPPVRAQPATDPPARGTTETPERAALRELQQQAARLVDPYSKPDERDQAAERLVRRRTADAKDVLLQSLQDPRNRPAQLAVAKALALESVPDEDFIPPLLGLLGRDPVMTEAAAQALAEYNRSPRAQGELLRFVQNTNQVERSRVVAIRALGAFIDKTVAATLVGFLGDPRETAAIRNAATDALVEMTGLQQFGRDVGQWQRWWAGDGALTDEAFRETQLNRRVARYALVKREYQRLADHVKSLLNKVYDRTPPEQRTEQILSWLKDSEPSIRAVAADVVQQQKANGQRIAGEVIEQLRGMVGDSSAEVRLEVVMSLKQINDAGAVDALLTQLAVETEPDVKVEIAHTLARSQNVKAVDSMLRQLGDPSSRVAEAAAECLRDLGESIRRDREVEKKVAPALAAASSRTAGNPGADTLRGAIVEAIAALRDDDMRQVFYRSTVLNRDNTVKVRVAACRGLGEMQSPAAREGAAQQLVRSLNNDPEPSVRLAAVMSLGNVGTFDQADAVYTRMTRTELDPSVREAAWGVLRKLLAHSDATSNQLSLWPNRFPDDPEKRLVAQKAWRDKLTQDISVPDLRDRALKDRAGAQENIGKTLMELNKPDEASVSFRAALDYWLSINANRATTSELIKETMHALLLAKKYPDAAKFAGERIHAAEQDQETMGLAIRNELERLQRANDLKSAKELIDEAAKIDPALHGNYADSIRRLTEQIEKKLSSQGSASPSGATAGER